MSEENGIKYKPMEEKEMLENFWAGAKEYDEFVTYNGRGFDAPFLALRSYLPADHPDKAKEIGSEATPGEFIDTMLDVVEECRRVLAPHGSLVFEPADGVHVAHVCEAVCRIADQHQAPVAFTFNGILCAVRAGAKAADVALDWQQKMELGEWSK